MAKSVLEESLTWDVVETHQGPFVRYTANHNPVMQPSVAMVYAPGPADGTEPAMTWEDRERHALKRARLLASAGRLAQAAAFVVAKVVAREASIKGPMTVDDVVARQQPVMISCAELEMLARTVREAGVKLAGDLPQPAADRASSSDVFAKMVEALRAAQEQLRMQAMGDPKWHRKNRPAKTLETVDAALREAGALP